MVMTDRRHPDCTLDHGKSRSVPRQSGPQRSTTPQWKIPANENKRKYEELVQCSSVLDFGKEPT